MRTIRLTRRLTAALIAIVLLLTLGVPMSFAESASPKDGTLKIMTMSDTHMIMESMIRGTEDYRHAIDRDQKVFNESEAVVDAQLAQVRNAAPDVLILCGDLTKDGEYKGHQALAKKLRALKKAVPGLKIYLINGNHDINNSDAREFNTADGKAVPAKKTTPQDFRKIYDDITWQDKSVKETYGLSYMARPAKGFTVIAIDSNCYTADTNSDGLNEHETRGAIPADVLNWAARKAKVARKRGDTVLGIMHHGVVAHFTQEPTIMGDFLVDDFKRVSSKLADAGMHYVFTGHFHAQDVSVMRTEAGNTLYDIETGSSITYPCPMRALMVIREQAGKADTDNTVKETVKGLTIQDLSISHRDPQTGAWKDIPDMTAYSMDKGLNPTVIVTILKEALGETLGNYPDALDTAIDKLLPDLLNMPVTEDGKHSLMETVNYAHKRHLAGLDHGNDPAWFREAQKNVEDGKFLAALTDTLCKDLAVLTGQGVGKLTKTDLVDGPAVDALYHGLFGAAHVSYYTAPQIAADLNEFLAKTLDSLAHDKSFQQDRDFTITGANVVRPGQADWSSIDHGIPETNVTNRLIGALLGNG